MTQKKLIIFCIIAILALCVGLGDKKRVHYMYERYISSIFQWVQMNPYHSDVDQTDELPPHDTEGDIY